MPHPFARFWAKGWEKGERVGENKPNKRLLLHSNRFGSPLGPSGMPEGPIYLRRFAYNYALPAHTGSMVIASDLRRGPSRNFGAAVAVSDGHSAVSCSKTRPPLPKFAEPALRLEFSSANTIPGYCSYGEFPGSICRGCPGQYLLVTPLPLPLAPTPAPLQDTKNGL